ncbi:MAG: fructose-bisphosphate aldolase, partial [Ilumatobacteraceae bacterium]
MDISTLLNGDTEGLLTHVCKGVPKSSLTLPGPNFVSEVMTQSDRSPVVLRNLSSLYNHGRL